ncbi:metal-dependent transcriptional regulator [Candidatus Bathyarchaeota archaeon]|nr:metal-dependent transcriptional regulator [Candidatus Bathyarchaeota archaeon]
MPENKLNSLSEREEDYLRAIYEIICRKGYARIKDIAKEVEVRPPTAVEMMKKLARKGLVKYEKYGGVSLTSQGSEIAMVISKRHETFTKFLEIILVPREIALKDAHILEHQLNPKTILQFTRFVEFITGASDRPRIVGRWMEMFKNYCEALDRQEARH